MLQLLNAAEALPGTFLKVCSRSFRSNHMYVHVNIYVYVCIHTHTSETKCETNTVIAEKYHPIPVRTHLTLRENKEKILSK